ncbi:hypothetical protein CEF21_15030 [Bacillus sp. FJAT-42376]|nr:hypothetical protein CEF21_15030 [Bacillus sp. FJAT-42376]
MQNDKIRTMLCIPGRNCPGDKNITAKVIDGEDTKFFAFGPYNSNSHIVHMLPRLIMDSKSKRRRQNS